MAWQPFAWIAVAGMVVIPLTASADPVPISSIPIDMQVGLPLPGDSAGRFTLRMANGIELFAGHLITAADIGQSILANATNEPDFTNSIQRPSRSQRLWRWSPPVRSVRGCVSVGDASSEHTD